MSEVNSYWGEIRLFAGPYAPEGWCMCDGRLLPISEYEQLFSLIGTTYGGDGVKNFALPNLNGRVPIHQGQGLGLTNRVIGQTGGEVVHTLTTAEIGHSHTMQVSSTIATIVNPVKGVMLGAPPTPGPVDGRAQTLYGTLTSANTVQMAESMLSQEVGGGQGHVNMMPTMSMNYIIALQGEFPVRN